ncbi:MAG: hypothetical protein U0T69_01690 [Chitinophagales bacterium]
MKYYLITNATNKKETGLVGPQCMVFPSGYNLDWYEQPNSMTKLSNDRIPDFEPELIFELDKKAKLTDFISQSIISSRGLLINKKVKDILEQFRLPEHKFYPAKIFHKNEVFQYFWLHLIDNNYDDIDYSKSIFYEGYTAGWKKENVTLNCFEDLIELRNKDFKLIFAENLVFKDSQKYTNFDMLLYSYLHQDIIISKEVISSFVEKKITGYRIIEQDII